MNPLQSDVSLDRLGPPLRPLTATQPRRLGRQLWNVERRAARCCSRRCGRTNPRYAALSLPEVPAVNARLAFVISGWGVLDPLLRYELAKEAGNAELLENHHNFQGDAAAMEEGNRPACSTATRRSSCRRPWSLAATRTMAANAIRQLRSRANRLHSARGLQFASSS
jgi:hypothetical protein